ncbi:MAG: hypothetical protein LBM66_02740, partial [Bifidobacteriaceae bacterium]|nr:hypothetical protein [Bifidobacteriaceae bacterium]
MKTPVPPPPWEGIFAAAQESGPATLGQILAAAQAAGTPAQTRYWPWDKLRFETPPDGLSPEQWWAAVKIGRLSSRRDIPLLLDRDGSPFSYTLPDELLRGIEEIAAHAKGEISTPEAVTDSRTRDRFIVSSLTEEAITSSQLEGASTTRRVAKEMLRTGRPPHDRSERMIQNNYAAMRYVADVRADPLTPALILKIHEIVTAGTLDDEADAGRVRSDDGIAVRDEDDTLLHQPP